VALRRPPSRHPLRGYPARRSRERSAQATLSIQVPWPAFRITARSRSRPSNANRRSPARPPRPRQCRLTATNRPCKGRSRNLRRRRPWPLADRRVHGLEFVVLILAHLNDPSCRLSAVDNRHNKWEVGRRPTEAPLKRLAVGTREARLEDVVEELACEAAALLDEVRVGRHECIPSQEGRLMVTFPR
jgi:hypothetical protein